MCLSFLGDIFDKDMCNSLFTSLDLYLVIILVNIENAVSNEYLIAKGTKHFDRPFRQEWIFGSHGKSKCWE